ncbi:ankyrin repeat domain-containing protein 65-like [Homalodisca vitripennis]|uniref:ankyrin repeat domain-containing protein 65-like n=1 Tax=Homalodisca vitripennis TaxID=197043 RepID=UPI001EE9B87E|nr:ankyrin repeat domain-containing protein 65-like [Homalodisca vitripennis]
MKMVPERIQISLMEEMEALLNQGQDINAQDEYGRTLLDKAVWRGSEPAVDLLLERGADVNICNNRGRSPLHLAVYRNNATIFGKLFDKGGNLNLVNKLKSPLELIIKRRCLKMIETLIDKEFVFENEVHDFPLLHYFVYIHYVSGVEVLLKKGAYLNCKDKRGKSPLHIAICRQYIDITQILLNKGAVVDIGDNEGETPLHCAIKRDFKAGVELLLRQERRGR